MRSYAQWTQLDSSRVSLLKPQYDRCATGRAVRACQFDKNPECVGDSNMGSLHAHRGPGPTFVIELFNS